MNPRNHTQHYITLNPTPEKAPGPFWCVVGVLVTMLCVYLSLVLTFTL